MSKPKREIYTEAAVEEEAPKEEIVLSLRQLAPNMMRSRYHWNAILNPLAIQLVEMGGNIDIDVAQKVMDMELTYREVMTIRYEDIRRKVRNGIEMMDSADVEDGKGD